MKPVFRLFLTFLFAVSAISIIKADTPQEPPSGLEFQIPPKNGPSKSPRKPAFCPLQGYYYGNYIFISSAIEGEAVVTVYDNSGYVVFNETEELSQGLNIHLPEDCSGGWINIFFNEKEYIAEFGE